MPKRSQHVVPYRDSNKQRGEPMEELKIVVDIRETIKFFDEIPDYSVKQATSVVSVTGEDLAAGCFQRYLEKKEGATVCIRSESVTTGKQKGPRLDRWIVVDWPDGSQVTFQTEIKNSSAHATQGVKLPLNIPVKELRDYKKKMWEKLWDSNAQSIKEEDYGHRKVLTRMKPPLDLADSNILPLLILWTPIAPSSESDNCLFKVSINPSCCFRELWVFSISSYLRSLKESKICLKMPIAVKRLQILNRLFQLSTGESDEKAST